VAVADPVRIVAIGDPQRPDTDTVDSGHPNPRGDAKIAADFFAALEPLLIDVARKPRDGNGPASADYVWLEGEKPAAMPASMRVISAALPHFLSGRQWLSFIAEADEVEKKVPAEGLTISYPFTLRRGGSQQVWARIGFEFARAPLEWRIDGTAWKKVSPDDLTTDLIELSRFCEVAWLKLADVSLSAGQHTLEIHLPRFKNSRGENQRMLFALDALCISAGEFVPHGPNRPGEVFRTEKDEQAAKHVFRLPEIEASAARSSVKLAGLWEVCRHDEQLPTEVAAPIRDFPAHPFWTAIEVPGDKNTREDLVFAHRLWYRTRVDVPASHAGRSFHIVFPANSLNTTVYANGVYCGFDKNPLARVQIDVTKGIKPGQVNEIWVGIKDIWYAYEADPQNPRKLRRTFNTPLDFLGMGMGFQTLVYPVWNQRKSGIISTPELVSAGSTYAADVFAKPSVARKELGMEVTLANPTGQPVAGELICEAVNDKTGQVEMTAPVQAFSIPAGKEQLLDFAAKWENPGLWWPDEPNLYRLRTTVKLAGKPVDVKETLFGFREWTIDGIHLRLNGVKWQGFSEQGPGGDTLPDLIAIMKDPKRNYGFLRTFLSHDGQIDFLGKAPEEFLTIMDRAGVLIRRSGYLDGEAIGYMPSVLKPLAPNWYDHLTAWMKGERNHPSVMLWSVENELNFINARNMNQLDIWEPILTQAREVVRKADPTRPMMIDGGGATRANTLAIHGDHYSTKPFWNYPQLAYEANPRSPCGNWTWDQKRPKFIGEELFAAGINPAYAYFGGEAVFQGKAASRAAVGKAMQVISQGYRWFGITGCDFCQSFSDADGSQYNGWAPRAVLARQWDWTFAAGQKAARTFGIFNGTRFANPLAFTWTLTLDGKTVATQTTEHKVAPGENEKFDVEISMPRVAQRQEGELLLTLSAAGKEVFRDVKKVSVLPPTMGTWCPKPRDLAALGASEVFVYDPQGLTLAVLKDNGIPCTTLSTLAPPPVAGKVWLVGKDALTAAQSTTGAPAAYAATGGRVLVLEQEHPLRYQGLNPAEIEAETNVGRVAFSEDLGHPILRGLKDKDFFTWEPGEIVYRNAYAKPKRGAKSLLQCNESLANSALVVIPVGPGVMTLCQAVVAEKAATNPTARTLLLNLIDFSRNYKLDHLAVAAAVDQALAKVLDGINLQYARAAGPLEALAKGPIAVVSATPGNLKTLADNRPVVRAFTQAGGCLVLHGLTPNGLADYNKLVGFDHMIRPFRRERVTFAPLRHPLTAGLGLADVQLYSSQAMFSFQSGNYVASDTFGYIVDLEDVAPFATPANGFHYNLVSGMTSADGWPYICNEPAEKSVYTFTLPKPQTIASWTWVGNVNYDRTSRVSLTVDGDEAGKLMFDVPEKSEPITLEVRPPKRGTVFTIRHEKHTDLPDKKQNGKMILGCDSIVLLARRPADFPSRVKPMLNIGGMVEYPQGKGRIVLCNLLFKDSEEVPANAVKKRTVLTTLLQNMKAPFVGKTVIAGANLAYAPLDLSKQANQFRTERGWFGDPKFSFKDLPTGKQTFAGVEFNVYEFVTSPVPTAVMLGGPGVRGNLPERVAGVPVGRKADALFFLHAARVDQPRSGQERKENKPIELAKYVIHYADGKTDEVPLGLEIDIDDYKQPDGPRPLPGAQVGWVRKYEGTEFHAVSYVKQWNNPRPDMLITSLDLVYGKDRRGVPVLLAVTAATVTVDRGH
jgi:beta-galactosidase